MGTSDFPLLNFNPTLVQFKPGAGPIAGAGAATFQSYLSPIQTF